MSLHVNMWLPVAAPKEGPVPCKPRAISIRGPFQPPQISAQRKRNAFTCKQDTGPPRYSRPKAPTSPKTWTPQVSFILAYFFLPLDFNGSKENLLSKGVISSRASSGWDFMTVANQSVTPKISEIDSYLFQSINCKQTMKIPSTL